MNKKRILLVFVIICIFLTGCDALKREIVVINGTGSGSYPVDSSAIIEANEPAPSYMFYRWVGEDIVNQHVADVRSAKTRIMIYSPGKTVVKATYKLVDELFTVNVISGDGSGPYLENENVKIFAAPPGPGYYFSGWEGDIEILDDPMNTLIVFPMPGYNLELTATYRTFNN